MTSRIGNSGTMLNNNLDTKRILAFAILVLVVFLIYVVRLFYLQILNYDLYFQQAEDNRTTTINIPTQRGIIYDRNGIVLAMNIPSYNVTVTQALLPDDPGAVDEIMRELSALTGVPVTRGAITDETPFVECTSDHGIEQVFSYGENSYPFQPVRIACDIKDEIAKVIQEKSNLWTGIEIEVVAVRDYPTGYLTSNIIGFLGPLPAVEEEAYKEKGFVPNRDKVGYSGVELYFQEELGGRNGLREVARDVAGQYLPDIQPPQDAVPGYNLELSIDTRLQQAVYSILTDELNFWNNWLGEIKMTSGVAIVIDTRTGEILAMVSYPTYENNRLARFIPAYYFEQLSADPTEPLRNHAVYAELPAGSVFKLVTATGGLNEGVVTPDQIIKTPGKLVVAERFYVNDPGRAREFVDWIYKSTPDGFGQLDFTGAVANSSNVYFYKVGGGFEDEVDPGLGICRLGTYARALGYGDYPAIQLPETSDGLIPDPDWKRINQGESWTTGDTYIMSVGQGYALATPLQVLMSAATIANDGKLMEPTILRQMLDGEGNVVIPFTPAMRWDLTQDAVIEVYEDNSIRGCQETGEKKTVEAWVFEEIQKGMRMAVTEGTLASIFGDDAFQSLGIAVAGKTGTAEYCDKYANAKKLCVPGSWPSHAWTVAYAPYENPEIAVVGFVYNGQEGSSVAGPIVRRIIEAYFELKRVDSGG